MNKIWALNKLFTIEQLEQNMQIHYCVSRHSWACSNYALLTKCCELGKIAADRLTLFCCGTLEHERWPRYLRWSVPLRACPEVFFLVSTKFFFSYCTHRAIGNQMDFVALVSEAAQCIKINIWYFFPIAILEFHWPITYRFLCSIIQCSRFSVMSSKHI